MRLLLGENHDTRRFFFFAPTLTFLEMSVFSAFSLPLDAARCIAVRPGGPKTGAKRPTIREVGGQNSRQDETTHKTNRRGRNSASEKAQGNGSSCGEKQTKTSDSAAQDTAVGEGMTSRVQVFHARQHSSSIHRGCTINHLANAKETRTHCKRLLWEGMLEHPFSGYELFRSLC